MIIKKTICIAAFLAFIASSAEAKPTPFQREISTDSELPVNVKAVKMNYDSRGENLIAKGNVEITQGDRLLKADYVKFNLKTKDAHAKGKVELYESGDILYCDSFNINLETQVGSVQHARLFVKKENMHITGKNIKKLGINTYQVHDGTITTCDGDSPPWRIDAGKIDLTVEGYAWVKNSTFRVKKIPVFYFPFALLPVKTERQSGFLFPEIGHSSSKGVEFNNSFFWAINENTDATFFLDTASKKGLGTGLEYRFKLKEDTWGKFYGYTASEKDHYFDDEYRDVRDRDKDRAYLNFEGEHYFSPDAYVKAQGSYISDREFYGDYRDEVNRSKGELHKTHIKSLEKDESLAFFNKNWDFSNLLINVEYYKNLMRSDHDVVQRMPQVVFSTMRMPFLSTPLFYQFDSSYDYFWRDEGQKSHRVDVFPKLSLPVNYNGWLKFNPEFGLQGISYRSLEHGDENDTSGIFPNFKAELSANFIRIFNFEGKLIQKLKHTIEPGVLYEYVTDNDQDEMPDFDVPERFFRRHSISYYIKNRFTGLIADKNGELEEYEIGYFLLGRSYNFTEPLEGLYMDGSATDDHSDIFGELRFGVWPKLYFITKAAYTTSESRLRYYKALVNLSLNSDNYLQFGYMYERERFRYLYEWEGFRGYDLRGRFRLVASTYAFFDLRYNNNRDDELETEIGFDYAAQCWGSKVYIETTGASAGRKSETSFFYRFYLKGLGSKL